jgi:uncharacterized protein YraI
MHHSPDLSFPRRGNIARPVLPLYRSITLFTVFATVFGGLLFLLAPVAEAGNETRYVIDGSLNLRSGPSTETDILLTMPDGAAVELTGGSENGFSGVIYNGTWGWAFSDYLAGSQQWDTDATTEVEDSGSDPAWVPVSDSVTGYAWVHDGPLNLRDGPSVSHTILDVMPTNASFELRGDVQSGFQPLAWNGTTGWASAEFITVYSASTPDPGVTEDAAPDPGADPAPAPGDVTGEATVQGGRLNLRSGPDISSSVLTVLEGGVTVTLLGEPQNGYSPVRYNGTDGWAFSGYLSTGNPGTPWEQPATTPEQPVTTPEPVNTPAPAAPVDPGADGWSADELIQIIYDAADAYGQPREDMLRVAKCESVLDPSNVNSSSGASGLFQFMPGTWLTTPFADQDIFDPVANANAAAWMWSVGRRNEWVCQ